MLRIGQIVDRYEVLELIEEGGVAVVYRARHVEARSEHALKVLALRLPDVAERMIEEGRVQSFLRHPNVVAVTDVINAGGVPALVMDYVDGPSLHELLGQHGSLPVDRAKEILRDILLGVRAAHRIGWVHRDLKAENVLIAENDGDSAKVTDFGLGKLIDPHRKALTETGMLLGTPGYMAPEQIDNPSGVDARADLYAIGVIFYEMLTGRLPFEGSDPVDLRYKMKDLEYVRLRDRPGMDPALDDVVHRLLQPDPAMRPQTCDDLLEELFDIESPTEFLDTRKVGVQAAETPAEAPRSQVLPMLALLLVVLIAAWVVVASLT